MDGSVVEIVPLAGERAADEPMPSRGALWSQIRSEAAGVVQNEPLLGSLITRGCCTTPPSRPRWPIAFR